VPVRFRDRILGVLEVINPRGGRGGEEDLPLLLAFSNQVAIAVENSNLYEQLRETFFGTALSLADSLEKRDPYTGGHTKRVSSYSVAIGRVLGLDAGEMEIVTLVAILHDIGKSWRQRQRAAQGGENWTRANMPPWSAMPGTAPRFSAM
jgi:hypothetical protein